MRLSKNRQQDYFRLRWENFMIHFERFAKRTNAEDLHRMRVELKKIKALIFLDEYAHGKKHSRLNKLIRKIFQKGGRIREAQINTQLFRSMKAGNRKYFSEQRTFIADEAKSFVKTVSRNADELVKQNAAVYRKFAVIPDASLNKITKKLLKEIKDAFLPRPKIKQLHESRKQIKRLVYLHGMLSEKESASFPVNIDQLRKVEEETGKWHDAVIAKQLLHKYSHAASIRKLLDKRITLHLGKAKKSAHVLFTKAV